MVTFFTNPFVVYNFDEVDGTVEKERATVVESVLSGQLVGAYGITDKLQVGLSVPIIFQSGWSCRSWVAKSSRRSCHRST